jgi:isopentenyl diphosphate isomerase/L-lactate dehydrogenase-like FMN-dependent dehydrogenase
VLGMLGKGWLREANSGIFRLWEDLMFLHANWDGPIVLKGIRAVAAMDAHADDIVASNHGTFSRCLGERVRVCLSAHNWAPWLMSSIVRFRGRRTTGRWSDLLI